MTMLGRLVKAAQESPAWPAVFKADAAEAIVRAILQELREPEWEALWRGSIGIQEYYEGKYDGVNDASRAVWQGIIDHILSEGKDG